MYHPKHRQASIDGAGVSIADEFSFVTPSSPAHTDNHESNPPLTSVSDLPLTSMAAPQAGTASCDSSTPSPGPAVNGSPLTSKSMPVSNSSLTSASTPIESPLTSVSTSCHGAAATPQSSHTPAYPTTYISKYLVQYIPVSVPKPNAPVKRVSGARVLTSAKCAAILEEREEKKRKEKEEREKRKLEREKKKLEKEKVAKEKAEESARKSAERARQKEAQLSRKRSKPVAKRRKTLPTPVSEGSSSKDSSTPTSSSVQQSMETENQCCVCNCTYEDDQREGTGSDWVQCACKRWLHEECLCDIEIDALRREMFCP